MGEIVATDNGKSVREDKPTGTGTGGKRADSECTSTPDTNTSGGSRGRGGNGSGGTTERTEPRTAETSTEQKTEVSELAILTEEEKAQYRNASESEKKRLLRNAKRRERYAQQKKESGGQVKPRKVRQSQAKETTPVLDVSSLNMIVASLSSVVASRPNCEHWLLTETEINSITVPLSKMLAESQTFSNLGQYSNQIALCMACVTVFMPRLIVTVQKQKEVKKIERTGQHTNTNVTDRQERSVRKEKESNRKSDNRNVGNTSSNGSNNGDNVPWYGDPIC